MAEEGFKHKLKLFIWHLQTPPLVTVSRVLWIVLSGWGLLLVYLLAAVALVPTVVGIIFLPKMVQIAIFAFDPVSKRLVAGAGNPTVAEKILNVIWAVLFGWEIFLFHMTLAFVQALTIYGLANAARHFEIAKDTLFPYGKEVVEKPLPPRPRP